MLKNNKKLLLALTSEKIEIKIEKKKTYLLLLFYFPALLYLNDTQSITSVLVGISCDRFITDIKTGGALFKKTCKYCRGDNSSPYHNILKVIMWFI